MRNTTYTVSDLHLSLLSSFPHLSVLFVVLLQEKSSEEVLDFFELVFPCLKMLKIWYLIKKFIGEISFHVHYALAQTWKQRHLWLGIINLTFSPFFFVQFNIAQEGMTTLLHSIIVELVWHFSLSLNGHFIAFIFNQKEFVSNSFLK